jgi:membrane protein
MNLPPAFKETLTYRTLRRYVKANSGTWASIIAWNGMFAFLPIAAFAVGLLTLFVNNKQWNLQVIKAIAAVFPAGEGGAVVKALQSFQQHAHLILALSVLGMIWTGSGFFGAIESAFSDIYHLPKRSFVKQKVMSTLMILLMAVAIIPLIVSTIMVPNIEALISGHTVRGHATVPIAIQAVSGVLDGTILFSAIYFVVPNRRQRWSRVILGALFAGVLVEALSFLFPLYTKLANTGSAYGQAFIFVFVLMTYFFFLAQIVVLGACLNAELEGEPVHRATLDHAADQP